ncbi:hypothetical protein PIB30_065576 [Stylosanthes scabra]|uniref:Uncharacterized protein n=1 Tax=Stylosanthes scabra TaxID=79078 RepID=A0ABU6TLX1_9FABA|nr:hypothetical protein [Stylosanthes scabra]
MARDGGRGRGAATRGRGRPRKNTGIPLNLDPEPRPATSTPTTTTTTATHTTTPPIVATSGPSAGLPHMVMIPTPGSRVQSSETGGPGPVQQSPHVPETQTSSQHLPTPDTDVADEDAEAAASATADTRPLLIWDGHDCWDQKRFRFRRGDEANMRKAWESRAAKRHRGLMHNIREKGAPHDWIPNDIFARYEAF